LEWLVFFLRENSYIKSLSFQLFSRITSIQTKAVEIGKEVAQQLIQISEKELNSDIKTAFLDSCSELVSLGVRAFRLVGLVLALLTSIHQVDSDFVTTTGKRVLEARKKALEGVGKGIARICSSS
jgi:N-terminal acetyltransferase B complex non-catalytic subunit